MGNSTHRRMRFSFSAFAAAFGFLLSAHTLCAQGSAGAADLQNMAAAAGIGFEENRGQLADGQGKPVPFVLFSTAWRGMNLYITETGLSYVMLTSGHDHAHGDGNKHRHEKPQYSRADLVLEGASIRRENIVYAQELQGEANYFFAHCPKGITGVKKYGKAVVRNVYPGIDWVWYVHKDKGLKYDFVVHPGADPSLIKMRYKWADISGSGQELKIKTPTGELVEGKLQSYCGGASVSSSYNVRGSEVRFSIGEYDKKNDLIIDPPLAVLWGTYFGGTTWEKNTDISHDIDAAGNIFVTCNSNSNNFPTQNPGGGAYFSSTNGGGSNNIQGKGGDVCIMKFSNAGVLVWSTFYGGSNDDNGISIACNDATGEVYVTGSTSSSDFPMQVMNGAYNQGTFAGGTTPAIYGESGDAFIIRVTNAGALQWATYFGGSSNEIGYSITPGPGGSMYIAGGTNSSNMPTQNPGNGAYFSGANAGMYDAFLLKLDNACALTWSTYIGGTGDDIAQCVVTDQAGKIYLTGSADGAGFPVQDPGNGAYYQATFGGSGTTPFWYRGDDGDAFITRLSSTGALEWSTYYGGNNSDAGRGIAVDAGGDVYVSGDTRSPNFPLQSMTGAYNQGTLSGNGDAFYLRFSSAAVRLWSTYFGGSADEHAGGITTDGCGNLYGAGHTWSTNMPTADPGNGAYYVSSLLASDDVYFLMFDSNGAMDWSTYNGTVGFDEKGTCLRIDPSGKLFITGYWCFYSTSNGMANPGGGAYYKTNIDADDFFIMKFDAVGGGQLSVTPQFADVQCSGACDGSASATAFGSCSPPITYLWQPGGQTTSSITGLCPGSYTVTVSDSSGASVTTTITITEPPPVTGGINGDLTIVEGDSTQLTASGGTTYLWSNGATTPTITVNPTVTTTYSVLITDADGCLDSASVTVVVEDLCDFSVPNVFSPNGDGQNDFFIVTAPCVKEIRYDIYNRWGQLLWTSTSLTPGWDGRIKNGNIASDGTYYYVLSGVMLDGTGINETGFLTLVKEK